VTCANYSDDTRRRAARAEEWLARLPTATQDELEKFQTWLMESALNVREFLRARALDEALRALGESKHARSRIDEQQPTDVAPAVVPPAHGRRSTDATARSRTAPALVGVGVLLVGALILAIWKLPLWAAKSATPFTSQLEPLTGIALADGSVMDLDAATHATVSFSRRSRDVRLSEGAVSFDVKKDESRPFRVRTSNITAQAVGTSYSVSHTGTKTVVTVARGHVRVWASCAWSGEGEAQPVDPGVSQNGVLLHDRQRLTFDDDSCRAAPRLEDLSTEELHRQLAWREHEVWFEGRRLRDAIEIMNRYNPQKLVIADDTIADREVSGTFRANDVNDFVEALDSIHVAKLNDGVAQRDASIIRLVDASSK
jgi:transmembrane sensor